MEITISKILGKFGDRSIIAIIYFASAALHILFSLRMTMISIDPNEFVVAAYSNLFAGKDWSGVVSAVDYYYGYGGALFYAPIAILVKDVFLQYKLCLVVNGALVALVPAIAYRIALIVAVPYKWQRILIAVASGFYGAEFARTKFIWNETFAAVIPWIAIYALLLTSNLEDGDFKTKRGRKKYNKKALYSIGTALVLVYGYATHPRSLVVSAAIIFAIVAARVLLKKKTVILKVFVPSLVFFAVVERRIRETIVLNLYETDVDNLKNSFFDILSRFSNLTSEGALSDFLKTLLGHLYYFCASTWGMGALALCLLVSALISFFKGKKLRAVPDKADNSDFGINFLVFCFYAFGANAAALVLSAFYKFPEIHSYQDGLIFGRYMDGVIPLIAFIVVGYVCKYGVSLNEFLKTVALVGVIFAAFFAFAAETLVNAASVQVSSIIGLYPVRIGEKIDKPITFDGLLSSSSLVFCFLALFIVLTCCFSKYRASVVALCLTLATAYGSFYVASVYLPYARVEGERRNVAVYDVSAYVYNSSEAPPLYAYKTPRRAAALIQYLSPDAKVFLVDKLSELPDDCFILVRNVDRLGLRPDSSRVLRELAFTSEYTLYAYGEKASSFVKSQ